MNRENGRENESLQIEETRLKRVTSVDAKFRLKQS